MNPAALKASQRVRDAIASERVALLDHGVSFLVEDGWRNPWSTDPLRPSYRSEFPIGKQAHAYASSSGPDALAAALARLAAHLDLTRRKVQGEMRAAEQVAERRLRAAQEPLAVIEPRSSLPGLQQTVEELEKRCRLPIEEIRGCFRQGRRSATQKALRELVEHEIRAMVKHHRMLHPVFGDPTYGRRQWLQARQAWREFIGGRTLQAQNNRRLAFEVFGEIHDDETGETHPGSYSLEEVRPEDLPRRASRSPKRPQIVPRLSEALGVHPNVIRTILAESVSRTPEEVEGQLPQEAA